MSKMTCMEAICEVLTEGGTACLEHQCFDDIVMGCFAWAISEGTGLDVPRWIAAHDKERSEEEVCLDICDYFRRYHGTAKPSVVMALAIAAGKAAL